MAVPPSTAVSRLAVARARARMPGLVPDTVEVVDLTRARAFVVVRTIPAGVVVLDERGRLVRGRALLGTIARHLHAVARVRAAIEEARLDRRRQHVEHSIRLLQGQRRLFGRTLAGRGIAGLVGELETLHRHLADVGAELERHRELPPTERTLKRTVALLNEAARADRRVVATTRLLACNVTSLERLPAGAFPLRRWLVARLASSDLPLFYWELDAGEESRFVEAFVAEAVGLSR